MGAQQLTHVLAVVALFTLVVRNRYHANKTAPSGAGLSGGGADGPDEAVRRDVLQQKPWAAAFITGAAAGRYFSVVNICQTSCHLEISALSPTAPTFVNRKSFLTAGAEKQESLCNLVMDIWTLGILPDLQMSAVLLCFWLHVQQGQRETECTHSCP